ncbi:hypothetical protein Baya_15485 [Bagarius yarrelli]|uniref:Uncharacterized protein n=1 Tax=Bagarius yarrelli TaxID=175774 RepID=A0A556VBR2_BAGYA|nr:hypothetical protein Baya_15485 [Bagarius yarrelli]
METYQNNTGYRRLVENSGVKVRFNRPGAGEPGTEDTGDLVTESEKLKPDLIIIIIIIILIITNILASSIVSSYPKPSAYSYTCCCP